MKKHSPNFHTNLEEADKATNNRFSTFVWTLITVSLLLFGFSITSKAQSKIDTIPVRLVVSDSSWLGDVLQVMKGYEIIESYTHGIKEQHHTDPFAVCVGCTKYKTTYLNHKKQPLPDRIIVWMAIRRN